MDRKEKLEMLQKLSEKDLTKQILIPLFESEGMGFKSVRYTHKKLEFGKDIIYYKDDEFGRRRYTGVQVKKIRITTSDTNEIFRQTNEAFGEPFTDLSDNKKKELDDFVVLTSNEFLEDAKNSFCAALRGGRLDRLVTCIDGNILAGLIDKNLPSAFWDEYDYFNKYFNSMRKDFETIKDISAIGQKEPVHLENIYVSLKLIEEDNERELLTENEFEIFDEKLSDWEKEEVEERAERTKVLDAEKAVEDYNRLVIVGVPGSGKTTLLKFLALKACRENLERQERMCVPVPVTLRQLVESSKNLRAYIDKVFEKHEFPKAKDFVENDLKEGRCRILLDGFDELATKENQESIAEEIEVFVKKYPKAGIVVTSRVAGYHDELKGFTKVELMEFDDKQIEKFIENWFGQRDPDRAKSMFTAIKENERIKALARNPLMIAIIAIIFEEDRKLPQRRADLYKRCAEVLLNKWDVQKRIKNKYSSDKKELILRKLAFYGHTNNKRIMIEQEIIEEMLRHFPQIGLTERDAKEFLDEIWQRSYLLRQISMNSYDFLHLSFQEYFTALELKERQDGLPIIIQNLNKPWWEEPILLYAGISRDASALIKAVKEEVPEDIFYSNLMLFGKCIADADFTEVSLKRAIAYKLLGVYRTSEFEILRKQAINILALIKPDEVIDLLIRKLKNSEVKSGAATALGLIGSDKAVEPLVKTLTNDRDNNIRGRAATALGLIGSDKAVEPLVEALMNDEYNNVRGRAASALGHIANDKAIEPLLGALYTNKDDNIRRRIAGALGRIANDKTLELLFRILTNDKYTVVRAWAAFALGHIESDKAIGQLLETLTTDKNSYVRGLAASALGDIRSEKAINPLLEAMAKNGNSEVRLRVVSALGDIGSDKAVEPLLKVLASDKDSYARSRSASSLGNIGSDKAVEPLLKALVNDKESYVRGRVAYALGRIGSNKAIEPLIKALTTDKDSDVRGRVAYALGRIGSNKAIEPLIKALTTDRESNVQCRAAEALGCIGSETAIEPLIKALTTDKEGNVRGNSAFALGSIGSDKAVEPLLKALTTDKESNVRCRAAEALGRIGSDKAIETLRKALEDEGDYQGDKVKDAAFAALEKISRRRFVRITPGKRQG